MSISDASPDASNLESLKAMLNQIVSTRQGTDTGSSQLDAQTLQATANQLKDILPMLQFERWQAEDARDWPAVDAIDEAVTTCENALDRANAALIRTVVIGLNNQDMAEMQQLRQQIQAAVKTEQVIKVLIRVAGFFTRLIA
jgi:hypothetical protein